MDNNIQRIEQYSFQESMDMIINEKKCVDRAEKNKCNRDCANCDLVKSTNEIFNALDQSYFALQYYDEIVKEIQCHHSLSIWDKMDVLGIIANYMKKIQDIEKRYKNE